MEKNMKSKILNILLICAFLVLSITNINYAAPVSEDRNQTIDQVMGGAENFISGANTENTISQSSLKNTIDLIYNILLALGIIVAVVAGAILGVQFMVASADGKAELKERLVPYVVGCVVIFGAFGIWKIVMIFINTM
jgi:hypothetical protein